jgi:hypothetical protein
MATVSLAGFYNPITIESIFLIVLQKELPSGMKAFPPLIHIIHYQTND